MTDSRLTQSEKELIIKFKLSGKMNEREIAELIGPHCSRKTLQLVWKKYVDQNLKLPDPEPGVIWSNKVNNPQNRQKIIVDIEDWEWLDQYKWYIDRDGYAASTVDGKFWRMHRLILNATSDMVVDHINHEPRDNRRSNLRLITVKENSRYRKLPKTNKSGFKGISQCKTTGKWRALIKVDNKMKAIGTYRTKIEAARAYDAKAVEYFGEHALTNKALGLLNEEDESVIKALSQPDFKEYTPLIEQKRAPKQFEGRISSSGFKGVRASSSRVNPWRVDIRHNYHQIHVGYYATKEDAARGYDRAAIRLYGENAVTNKSLGLID